MTETVGPQGNCSMGFGAFTDGTVEIDSVTDRHVAGTVYTNSSAGWVNDPSGPFLSPRCF